jgi:hypothetical protein
MPTDKPDIGEITVLSSNLRARARHAAPPAALGRAALTISAVALATAALAACGGRPGPPASPSSAGRAGSAAAAASAAAAPAASRGPGAGAGGPDVCSVLTTGQVASITGEPVGRVTRGRAGASSTCSYSLNRGASSIEVEVVPHSTPADYSGFSGLVTTGASPPGSARSEAGLGLHAVASSFGVAVQGDQYAYLVLNAHGQVRNPLGSDLRLARILVAALG